MPLDLFTVLAPLSDLAVAIGLVAETRTSSHKVKVILGPLEKLLQQGLERDHVRFTAEEASLYRSQLAAYGALIKSMSAAPPDRFPELVQLEQLLRKSSDALAAGLLDHAAAFDMLTQVRKACVQ